MSDNQAEHTGSCYCSAVEVTVTGVPGAAGYCHCFSCRKWHSAPINAFCVFPKDSVQIEGDVTISQVDAGSERVSCKVCGGCVANRKPANNMIAVYAMTLAETDFKFEPAFHIFYEERVMDVTDGLPKYIDRPKGFGGSGDTMGESG